MNNPAQARSLDALGLAGVVFCCALWGGNAVAVKFAVPSIPPFGSAGLRFILGLPVIALICWQLGQPLLPRRRHLGLLAIHVLLTVVQIGTFNLGTNLSLAGRSTVFVNVHPLVVAPLSWLVLGERMGLSALSGLFLATAGVAILIAEKWSPGSSVAGDLIVLGSGALFGVQTIVQKKTFPFIAPATLLLGQTVLSVPVFLGFSGVVEGFQNYHFTQAAVGGLLYQGLGVSGLCFSIWMILLRKHPAGKLAALAFLTPIFGVAAGCLIRSEPLTPPLAAAGALVGIGILLVARERPQTLELPGEDAP